MLASWRSVAKLCRLSRDRLHESSDWNESNPKKVVAALDEVVLEADSSVLVADPRIDRYENPLQEFLASHVEVTMRTCCRSFWLHVNEEPTKTARTIYDADPQAKNKRCTLRRY
jgi:hypothetical protein